jgi:hypothetical protein
VTLFSTLLAEISANEGAGLFWLCVVFGVVAAIFDAVDRK